MARKRKGSRIYWRERGGEPRAWADFRDFADVGGKQEPLVPRGAKLATTDSDIAEKLASARVTELERARRNRALLGIDHQRKLEAYASHHLKKKARARRVTKDHLKEVEHRLDVAIRYFGADRLVDSISVRDVERFTAWLGRQSNGRGGTLSPGSQRHYLNALSGLFRRAAGDGVVEPGFNPVAAMLEKPTARAAEARWLEVHDAALLLESALTWVPKKPYAATDAIHPLLATFLLTGGRTSEVLGLELDDVLFDRKTITFRPNAWRQLKTRTSPRVVPLWPQLEEVLREHVFEGDSPPGRLLFPSYVNGQEQPLTDFRRSLDAVALRAGWKEGEIRSKAFRHTYCAARLQTLDRGAPISPWTVAKEMGHGGRQLVDRIYGHLGEVRHRSEVVEFRVENHREVLGDRLENLGAR